MSLLLRITLILTCFSFSVFAQNGIHVNANSTSYSYNESQNQSAFEFDFASQIYDNNTTVFMGVVGNENCEIPISTLGLSEVCVEIEHSYLGDLEFNLYAPDGTTTQLHSNTGGSRFLGVPLDEELYPGVPGETWEYCWSVNPTFAEIENSLSNVIPNDINGASATLIPGSYTPNEPFSTFDNINHNGTWSLEIIDRYSADDGYVTGYSLEFDGNLEQCGLGCTDSTAFNYHPLALEDDGTCFPIIEGCLDATASNYVLPSSVDSIDINTHNSDMCIYLGCTDSTAFNYDQIATQDDSTCYPVIEGCADENAYNYVSPINDVLVDINTPNQSMCIYLGCTDSTAFNYDQIATQNDGTCYPVIEGCTDDNASNYVSPINDVLVDINTSNQSMCIYLGCTDSTAFNFNEIANADDGSCVEMSQIIIGSTTYSYVESLNTSTYEFDTSSQIYDNDTTVFMGVVGNDICDVHNPVVSLSEVCVEIEHSYLGDLEFNLIAPDGTTAQLHDNAGGAIYLGLPIDQESSSGVSGETWEYCWSVNPTFDEIENSLSNVILNFSNGPYETLIPGSYTPNESFSIFDIVNFYGTWSLEIIDKMAADDGFVTGFSLEFDGNLGQCDIGCTDSVSFNYNPYALEDNSTCYPVIEGCLDETSSNYISQINDVFIDVNTHNSDLCIYFGCTDSTAFNYNEIANADDGSCGIVLEGCMDELAYNYAESSISNPFNTHNQDLCEYSGCTDSMAVNFNEIVSVDDGTCVFPTELGALTCGSLLSLYDDIQDDMVNSNYYHFEIESFSEIVFNVDGTDNPNPIQYLNHPYLLIFDGNKNYLETINKHSQVLITDTHVQLPAGDYYIVVTSSYPGFDEGQLLDYYTSMIGDNEYGGYLLTMETYDASCDFPVCTNPEALNYNSQALIQTDTCHVPTHLGELSCETELVLEGETTNYYGFYNSNYYQFTANTNFNLLLNLDAIFNPSMDYPYVLLFDSTKTCIETISRTTFNQIEDEIIDIGAGEYYMVVTNGAAYTSIGDNPHNFIFEGSLQDYYDLTLDNDQPAGSYTMSLLAQEGDCPVYGCTSEIANNFNPEADIDDGSCEKVDVIGALECAEMYTDYKSFYSSWSVASGGIFKAYEITLVNDAQLILDFDGDLDDSDYITDPTVFLFDEDQNFITSFENVDESQSIDLEAGDYYLIYCLQEVNFDGATLNDLIPLTSIEDNISGWYSFSVELIDTNCIYLGCMDNQALNYDDSANTPDESCMYIENLGVVNLDVLNCGVNSFGSFEIDENYGVGNSIYYKFELVEESNLKIELNTDSVKYYLSPKIILFDGDDVFVDVFDCYTILSIDSLQAGNYRMVITNGYIGSNIYENLDQFYNHIITDYQNPFIFDLNVSVSNEMCGYYGCTDSLALNYDDASTVDDASCIYSTDVGVLSCGNTVVLASEEINIHNRYSVFDFDIESDETIIDFNYSAQIDTLLNPWYYTPSILLYKDGNLLMDLIILNEDCESYWCEYLLDEIILDEGSYSILISYSYHYYDLNESITHSTESIWGYSATSFRPRLELEVFDNTCELSGCTDSNAFNYNEYASIEDESCMYYQLNMYDSYGDGWNGNYVNIYSEDSLLTTESLYFGNEFSVPVDLSQCTTIETILDGQYINEISWEIIDVTGEVIASGDNENQTSQLFYEGCGCMDSVAYNYDALAIVENGMCYPIIEGCMDTIADNYIAPIGDVYSDVNTHLSELCEYWGCTDSTAFNYIEYTNVDDGSCYTVIEGCMDTIADNYSELMGDVNSDVNTHLSELCEYWGCTDSTAFNYQEEMNVDDGSCYPIIEGCMDTSADNYNTQLGDVYTDVNTHSSELCEYWGCTDSTAFNYQEGINVDDSSCYPVIEGCMYYWASNFNPSTGNVQIDVNTHNMSLCEFMGCTDSTAFNYQAHMNVDDGSCYPVIEGCLLTEADNYIVPQGDVYTDINTHILEECEYWGCTDSTAFNYNVYMNVDDGSCYPVIEGCMNIDAYNYIAPIENEQVDINTHIESLCDYGGCTNENALNYNENTDFEDGSCNLIMTLGDINCGDTIQVHVELTALTGFENTMYYEFEINELSDVVIKTEEYDSYIVLFDSSWHHLETIHAENEEINEVLNLDVGSYYLTITDGNPEFSFETLHDFYNQIQSNSQGITSFDVFIEVYNDSCEILGCIDQEALNYSELANVDEGTCFYPVELGVICGSDITVEGQTYENLGIHNSVYYSFEIGENSELIIDLDGSNQPTMFDPYILIFDENSNYVETVAYSSYYSINHTLEIARGEYYMVVTRGNPNFSSGTLNDYLISTHNNFQSTGSFELNLQSDLSCDLLGCTDELASNYNAEVEFDDGTCEYNCAVPSSWEFELTGSNHTIMIPAGVEILLDGEYAGVGSSVGVFYLNDNEEMKCAGYSVMSVGMNQLAVMGDDSTTPEKDGVAEGELLIWKVWDVLSCEEYHISPIYSGGPETFTSNGLSFIEGFEYNQNSCQTIQFPEGWYMYSSYIIADNMNVVDVFEPIVESLIILKNNQGDVYLPEWGFNAIGDIDFTQGYQVKMTNPVELEICGVQVEVGTTSIELSAGWNMIAYLWEDPVLVDVVMQDVVQEGNLLILKDYQGAVYIPQWGFNGIGDLYPGQGYQLKIINSDILEY
jgi:subtilisin-like proprotein convertase family protein